MPPRKTFTERLVERLDRLDRRKVGDYLVSLGREKGLLENIFNSMQEGLIVITADRRVAFINQPANRLLELSPAQIGQAVEMIVKDPVLLDIVNQGFELPGQSLVREFWVMQPYPRWIRLSRSPLRDGNGAFQGIMLVISDITRQVKAEREVSLAQRLDFLGYLTAAVAHELGNPLSSLAIHIQLLKRQMAKVTGAGREKLLESITILEEEFNRLDEIVGQFLKSLRPVSLDLHKVDLRVVVDEVIKLISEELKEKKIALVKDIPSKPVRGRMDKNLIKQALLNLVKNSTQAMPEGGKVTIRVNQEGTYLKLSVIDQGSGIAPEEVSRVLEPFVTTRDTGTGLGLFIVYKIVRQHGGSVEVKTQAGRGTMVTIWLPRMPDRIKLLPPPQSEG